MKKISKILLCLILIISSTGCFNKTVLTKETFATTMENKGFKIFDASETYKVYSYIESVSIAQYKNQYQLEFYVFENEDYAKKAFNNNKKNFDSLRGGSLSSKAEVNAGNYSTYSITKNDAYMYLSRVDNTLLYIDVDKKYKDEVKNIIEELGY